MSGYVKDSHILKIKHKARMERTGIRCVRGIHKTDTHKAPSQKTHTTHPHKSQKPTHTLSDTHTHTQHIHTDQHTHTIHTHTYGTHT